MTQVLKAGKLDADVAEANRQVQAVVAEIIEAVRTRGDQAVRELSRRLDNWEPPAFRLTQAQIDSLIDELPLQTVDDLHFADLASLEAWRWLAAGASANARRRLRRVRTRG